ncbi:hypothetical protein TNIN_87561 [Trichonephila inaurata madagascariensis]|uniref:Uncharacterized protein n=1 Tax=Trichonephila inaurata madagascariensis TaxID=2747483 RepID=A0A8X6YJW4_9ARAC|nr:hypothetical protein TNIN_87561 [Trichonephila inaurata madagascariensis]
MVAIIDEDGGKLTLELVNNADFAEIRGLFKMDSPTFRIMRDCASTMHQTLYRADLHWYDVPNLQLDRNNAVTRS